MQVQQQQYNWVYSNKKCSNKYIQLEFNKIKKFMENNYVKGVPVKPTMPFPTRGQYI